MYEEINDKVKRDEYAMKENAKVRAPGFSRRKQL
jgi:hypothetical protein